MPRRRQREVASGASLLQLSPNVSSVLFSSKRCATSPLPRCTVTSALASKLCPVRNMQPHPVSLLNPSPPPPLPPRPTLMLRLLSIPPPPPEEGEQGMAGNPVR